MAEEQPEIALAIPIERNIHQAAFWAFMQIAQQGYPIISLPYMRTDLARNRYAVALLKSNYTHVLMLDSDQAHPPDIVEKLKRRVVEDPEKLIVSGLYFRRGEPYEPLAMKRGDDGYMYAIGEWGNGCFEVDVVGTGCLLISRKVFESLPGPPWFWYDYENARDDMWPTEDIAFCHLCGKHGIKIWLDTTVISPHISDTVIDERAFREFLRIHGDYEMMEVAGGNNAGN